MTDEFLRETSRDERHYEIIKQLGFTSYMTVPLGSGGDGVIGTVTLVSAGSGRRFSERDLGLAEQLATQVSSVVSRARAYERERRISHELQRHLLPDAIPELPGWDVAARYLPAAVGVEVGGDWYDVVPVSDRLVALVVGDVEGHDLEAARIMSRLRHMLGLLLLEERAPGKALERLNRVALSTPPSGASAAGHRADRRARHRQRRHHVLLRRAPLAGADRAGAGRRADRAPGAAARRAALPLQGPRTPAGRRVSRHVHRRPGRAARRVPRRPARAAGGVAPIGAHDGARHGLGLRDRRHDGGRAQLGRHRRAGGRRAGAGRGPKGPDLGSPPERVAPAP